MKLFLIVEVMESHMNQNVQDLRRVAFKDWPLMRSMLDLAKNRRIQL